MILIDSIGHMVSTESEAELHKFADELGMRKRWYQDQDLLLRHPHYDLTTKQMIKKALRLGTEQVSTQELIQRAWWRGHDSSR